MSEKEPTKTKKGFSTWEKLKIFLILIILGVLIILLIGKFSVPEKKTFSLYKKNNDDKIVIYGLNETEIDQIDWQKGAIWTEYYTGGGTKQYRLRGKKGNFFQRLFKKPKIYDFTTELKEHEIRGKQIEFENVSTSRNITIPTTEFSISKNFDMFAEKEWSLKNVFWILFYGAAFLISLYFLDMIFNTNFIGFISYPFRTLKRSQQEVGISKVKFKDIGGLQEAKEELGEVVTYFKNPQAFWQWGAKVPQGILFSGPPGNGKTMLAKALAGECGLPFLFRSGSEFEEMMVGVGARRMRELFKEARSFPQGCIIFIDEIDSIGRKRYSRSTPSHSEMTLNQLLNELDGFRPRDNIIILAATNSIESLDSALLRPGRFDRQIYIPLPSLKGRQEIIALHARKLPFKPDFDLAEIASMTRGFSGAQIVNMLNEASILSIRYNKKLIDYEIIFEAYDRVLMGPSLTSYVITPEKKKIVAYHEAGHAVIGMSLPETIVRKITIIPRLFAGGYTWIELYGEQGDDYMLKKNQMLADVMTFLGGRASEELIFGLDYITMGAASDFKQASAIIQDLILRYGMSDLGIIHTQESFLYAEEIPFGLPELTKQKIENEREKILNRCWKKVRGILRQKKQILKLLAEILLEKNSLHKDEINYIFINQISPYTPLLN